MSVQVTRKSTSDTETKKCPVCDEEYTRAIVIDKITILPDEIQIKHCFASTISGISIFEHRENEEKQEFDEEEAVEIEIE